ncbi:PREDICTED: programmed cell death protein 2-like, partial [Rhagoletis zephyria]|uniref:programmed cell death protein 2-like n=1 Tax=Rhagoletis zephyria TaxID=28612 RepID=UPI0008113992
MTSSPLPPPPPKLDLGFTEPFADGWRAKCKYMPCKLPKENRFYSSRPPEYDAAFKEDPDPEYDPNPAEFGVQLCPVCGVRAPHRCGRCQKTSYCSREHQVLHWKRGGHKAVCEGGGGGSKEEEEESKKEEVHYEGVVFPELELLIGDDDDDNKADFAENSEDDEGEVAESEMSKYRDYLRRNKPSLQTDASLNAYGESNSKFDQLEEEEADQIAFERFKKRSSGGEVIRYRADWYLEDKDLEDKDLEDEDEEDVILWISSRNKPTSIPPCPR